MHHTLYVVGDADAGHMKDEHGEVCPANWREGEQTIRGDPVTMLDYFAAFDGQYENGKINGAERARRPAKANTSVEDAEPYGLPHAGHNLDTFARRINNVFFIS